MVEEHLGGHKGRTHTDPGVLDYFHNELNCQTFIDVGCGPGGQVKLALDKGWEDAQGIDGDHSLSWPFDVDVVDFTKTKYKPKRTYDLAWCVEFLEHVEEQYIPNFMPALQAAQFCVVTHALPGEPGHHHVNCQTNEYWIEKFAEYGLKYDGVLTELVKEESTMVRDFIRRRGLVFVNNWTQ